ncbi:hypothetical protein TWF696_003499 [Orbilia brochopaga]|uniref:Peptidase S8/S53 domain-containing protein n=1 Tax=Orbilia brochopaga TaxID=3140254 RepID=A0AAV9TXE0_9PEZI
MRLSTSIYLHVFHLLLLICHSCDAFSPQTFGDVPFWYALIKPQYRNSPGFNDAFSDAISTVETNSALRYTAVAADLGTFFYVFQAEKEKASRIQQQFAINCDVFNEYTEALEISDPEADNESYPPHLQLPDSKNQVPDANITSIIGVPLTYRPSGWDLHMLSMPPGARLPNYGYYYRKPSGQNVTIYVIDSGANLNHKEFDGLRARDLVREWIWAGPFPATGQQRDPHPHAHGTKVLASIAGQRAGVVENSDIIIVQQRDSNGNFTLLNTISALTQTYTSIRQKRKEDKIVVNFSWGVGNVIEARNDQLYNALRDIISALHDLPNVILVCRAVTEKSGIASGYPALLADILPKLVIVGGIDRDGRKSSDCGPAVTAFAPAVDILSPAEWSNTEYKLVAGSSHGKQCKIYMLDQ